MGTVGGAALRRVAGALSAVALCLIASGSALASPEPRSTTFRANAAHTAAVADPAFHLPLQRAWQVHLPGSVSYPVIGAGRIFVTVTVPAPGSTGGQLVALDEASGRIAWRRPTVSAVSMATYDNGRVFVVGQNGLLEAFGAESGTPLWSVALPGQYLFSSPPVTRGGIAYTGGAGNGGTVYAVAEHDGQVIWTAPVMSGDDSSPALAGDTLFVSYTCQQAYAFDRLTGALRWHRDWFCEGGGGATPMLVGGSLLVEDRIKGNTILSRRTGDPTGTFVASSLPAAWHGQVYLQTPGTITGRPVHGPVAWRFSRDPGLDTAPLVVNGIVFAASSSGELYGLDGATGRPLWSSSTGLSAIVPAGLAAGDGMLLVPAQDQLLAYRAAS